MRPGPFEYHAAESVEHAVELLATFEDDGKALAGGQSLLPLLALRFAQPGHLVDLNRVPGLSGIRELSDGRLSIGALTRTADVESSSVLATWAPLLREAAGLVGHTAIRNRGTIGGSVAHADPAAELPGALVALGGTIRISGPDGERAVSADDFFQSYYTTDLGDSDILTELIIPRSVPGSGHAFVEESRRQGDFAMAGTAAALVMQDGSCVHARIVLIGVADRPYRAREAESLLVGTSVNLADVDRAAEAATAQLNPGEDIHASPEYRRALATVVTGRAIRLARRRTVGS
jgi:carbon-monoxide dehydrogenase medium subunit